MKCWWPIWAAGMLLMAACAGPGSAAGTGIGVGNRAPVFTLETLDGDELSLDETRGNVVLVNFWATWCEPCRAEIPAMEAAYRARQSDGFVVLGVNYQESPEDIEPFIASMDVSYPILLDKSGRVMKTFRAVGLPFSILVDRDGIIQVRHTGLLTATKLDEYLARLLP